MLYDSELIRKLGDELGSHWVENLAQFCARYDLDIPDYDSVAGLTVGQLVEHIVGGGSRAARFSWDTALPHDLVMQYRDLGVELPGRFVMMYDDDDARFGLLFPLYLEALKEAGQHAT